MRIIDPSVDQCNKVEQQVTWNTQGPAGTNGASPTVTPLSAGDSHCLAGGAAITDASGSTAYVCSAQTSGTFTSPNGLFSLTVSDTGVSIAGPHASVSLDSSGNVAVTGANESVTIADNRTETVGGNETIKVSGDRSEEVGGNETIKVSQDRSESVGGNESVKVGATRTETVGANESVTVGANESVTAGASLGLNAAIVGLNQSGCRPAAREGDLVAGGAIVTGSPTVCIG